MAARRARSRKHRFTLSHARGARFEGRGLRAFARYRDLGMTGATRGAVIAHVIRLKRPVPKDGTGWHYHVTCFQMVYVLKGWVKFRFKGHGTHTMRAGSCWNQPSGLRHALVDYSKDCELLEIVLPAKFETRDV